MLTSPIYLFALLGLAVPIAIHLLSRKEGKVIKLGSVRHLVETSTQQFKGIKLNEILLLFLRCAMIVVFSLLLSGLQCSSSGKQKWILIEHGLQKNPSINSVIDSLDKQGYEQHWLAEKFPSINDSINSIEINYWKLVEELRNENLSNAIVFSKNNINHFKGAKHSLPEYIKWISMPMNEINLPIQAIQLNNDSVLIKTIHSNADETNFTFQIVNKSQSAIEISPMKKIKIALIADDDFRYDEKILKAALQAIEKNLPIKIEWTTSKTDSTDWCIWLSNKKVETINFRNSIFINPQTTNDLLIQKNSNQWIITKRLNEEVALENNLTVQLVSLLLKNENFEKRISSIDRRMISDSLVWNSSSSEEKKEASIEYKSADDYLIILLLLLLLIERTIAYK